MGDTLAFQCRVKEIEIEVGVEMVMATTVDMEYTKYGKAHMCDEPDFGA